MTRHLSAALIASLAVVLGSCGENPTEVATTGSIAPMLVSEAAVSAAVAGTEGPGPAVRVMAPLALDRVTVEVDGPTSKSANLTLNGSNWEGSVDGLEPGSYTVYVRGFKGSDVDSYAELRNVNVVAGQTARPSATFGSLVPTSITATTVADTQINLSWSRVTNATGYTLQSCAGLGCSTFSQLATITSGGTTSYAHVGVAPNQSYSYRVRATAGSTTGGFSSTATANTNLPDAPTGLSAVPGAANRMHLRWSDVDNETGYEIERCTGASCTVFTPLATSPADDTTYTDNSVTANNTYRYQVRAVSTGLKGDYSTAATANTNVPGAPTLSVMPTNVSTVSVTWTDVANETGYELEHCVGASCSNWAVIASRTANTTSYTHTGRVADQVNRYRVRGVNDSIAGTLSAIDLSEVETLSLAGVITVGDLGRAWRHFVFTVPAGMDSLRVRIVGGTGDPDLCLGAGGINTSLSTDCSRSGTGSADQVVKLSPGSGTWYASVYRYSAYANWSFFAGITRYLRNGNFESALSSANWTASGSAGRYAGESVDSYRGEVASSVSTIGTLSQVVTVPANAAEDTIYACVNFSTSETTTTAVYDTLTLAVYEADGSTLLNTVLTFRNTSADAYYSATNAYDGAKWSCWLAWNYLPNGRPVILRWLGRNDGALFSKLRVDETFVRWNTVPGTGAPAGNSPPASGAPGVKRVAAPPGLF